MDRAVGPGNQQVLATVSGAGGGPRRRCGRATAIKAEGYLVFDGDPSDESRDGRALRLMLQRRTSDVGERAT